MNAGAASALVVGTPRPGFAQRGQAGSLDFGELAFLRAQSPSEPVHSLEPRSCSRSSSQPRRRPSGADARGQEAPVKQGVRERDVACEPLEGGPL